MEHVGGLRVMLQYRGCKLEEKIISFDTVDHVHRNNRRQHFNVGQVR
jgi:hypothetical protein